MLSTVWTLTGSDLARNPCSTGRVLDHRDDPACHEPCRPDRGAAPGQLADLDLTPPRDHFDAPARLSGLHVVGLRRVTGVHDDLNPIALHARYVPGAGDGYAA